MITLKNIPLNIFRKYLESKGLKIIRHTGGHEIWGGKQLKRPIVLQSHIKIVPTFVIKENLKTLNVTSDDLIAFLKKN